MFWMEQDSLFAQGEALIWPFYGPVVIAVLLKWGKGGGVVIKINTKNMKTKQ